MWLGARCSFAVVLAYTGAVLIGQWPVNRDFTSLNVDEHAAAVEVFVYVDTAHSEVMVPVRNGVRDWGPWFSPSDFKNITGNESYIAFGWGDRDFFLTTPTWDDVRAGTVARSMLLPTSTVMHVMLRGKPITGGRVRRVVIDSAAYEQMVQFIEKHFVLDGSTAARDLAPRVIPGYQYGDRDAFYEAQGTYSLFYTCNAWTGDALKVAGVRTGCWTPLPVGILQIPDANAAE